MTYSKNSFVGGSRRRRLRLACLCLAVPPCMAPAQPWTTRAEIPAHEGNLTFHAPWQPDRGATFRFTKPDSSRAATVDIAREGCRLSLSPKGPEPVSRLRSYHDALPDQPIERAQWTLKIRSRDWTLYIEDRPIFVFNAPFKPPAILEQPAAQAPPSAALRTRFQKTVDFEFNDNFFLPGDTHDPLVDWDQIAGAWQLRTAADIAQERGETPRQRARREPDPERSANFSSVRGQGAPGIMLAGHDFYDNYTLKTALATAPGETGLVFLHTDAGAYYALTLTMNDTSHTALLRLWRVSGQPDAPRETLAAAVTELTLDQWIKLKVKLYPNRIRGFLDNTEMVDIAATLPVGGRFGLIAHSQNGALFDDVQVRSNPDLHLSDPAEIRWNTLAEQGHFFPNNSTPGEEAERILNVARSPQDQWLILGDPDHAGHVFSADFQTEPDAGRIGLVIGYRDEAAPYLRFTRTVEPNMEIFRMEQAGPGPVNVLETLRLPRPENPAPGPVTLMADATETGLLRLYRNGIPVLVHHSGAEHRGASGVFVGANTAAAVAHLRYRFARDDVHHDRFEKNRVFREDPFMRNWASPEGEWAQDSRGLTWHKGDIYGRVFCRMPSVEGSEIHLGVKEDTVIGQRIVSIDNREIRLETATAAGRETLASASVENLAQLVCEQTQWATPYYDVHYEGHALWISSGDTVLIRHQLTEPLTGRRLRIDGFGGEDLAHSFVMRYNVKDYLFTESSHAWVRNGGEWSVVNRFQCDPRWSHMNGESTDGLAALWSKFDFSGDFCIELYAGMRHGFYERAGDLNLTVMSPSATPGQGYSVTCTGWDRDHSQLYTRLYRNGQVLAETDEYLIPRRREGNKRRILDPLVQTGRDIHGAWYYIKLRRIGNRLEYFFDNEPVFSVEDPDPIDTGAFGIWTFMNSMMVARVKMAAEHIAPRRRVFHAAPLAMTVDNLTVKPEYHALDRRGVLAKNWRPAESLLPHQWRADDPTGQTRLTWIAPPDAPPEFVATTVLGAGEIFTRAALQPDLYDELAGWTFEIKRTVGARFNFHYSLGSLEGDGAFSVKARCFHHLSGDDFSEGDFKKTGATPLDSRAEPAEDWTDREEWTRVTVWLPTETEIGLSGGSRLWARVDGFGNLKPSLVRQGLLGNGPGEAYAVRRFAEIRTHAPRVDGALPGDTVEATDLSSDPPRSLGTYASVNDLKSLIDNIDTAGAIRLKLTHRATDAAWPHDWHWINLPKPADLNIRVAWHPDIPDAVRIEHAADWLDRRFLSAAIRIGDHTAESWLEGDRRRIVLVPRLAGLTRSETPAVPVDVRIGDAAFAFELPWSDAPREGGPVLLGLGKTFPDLETFEAREPLREPRQNEAVFSLEHLDPRQGSYLRIANAGQSSYLRASLLRQRRLSQYPLLQFRYRASAMANISMQVGYPHPAIKLRENHPQAVAVRGTETVVTDGSWRTWFGMVSDAMGSLPLGRGAMRPGNIVFGSLLYGQDQTGLFSTWDVDDLVRGPAVSARRPLTLVPDYFSFHGVNQVLMALHPGETPASELDAETLARLNWQTIVNRQSVSPDTARLPDGIHRVFLKARSASGRESALTDIPFLLVNNPPAMSHQFIDATQPIQNGPVLEIAYQTGNGAPIEFDKMQLKWNDEPIPPERYGDLSRAFSRDRHPSLPPSGRPNHAARTMGTWYRHGRESSRIHLNWSFVFQDRIQELEDGAAFTLSVSGLQDGAGNPVEDAVVPMRLDFSGDTAPPTIMAVTYPNNIYWSTDWDRILGQDTFFDSRQTRSVVREQDQPPYFEHTTEGDSGVFFAHLRHQGGWRISRHPYLAFQLKIPDENAEQLRVFVSFRRRPDRNFVWMPLNGTNGPAIYRDNNGVTAPLSEPVSWKPGDWHSFVLDMREIVADVIPEEEWEIHPLYMIIFSTENDTGTPIRLQMRNGFIFSEWNAQHEIGIHAYDASGIDSPVWSLGDHTMRTPTLIPANAFPGDTLNRWMNVRVLDRAGNGTYPIGIPLGRIAAVTEQPQDPPKGDENH